MYPAELLTEIEEEVIGVVGAVIAQITAIAGFDILSSIPTPPLSTMWPRPSPTPSAASSPRDSATTVRSIDMVALEIVGLRNGFMKLKNQSERSDLLDIRQSTSLNLKPLRRRMVQVVLIAESASSSSWSSASTCSSFPSIGLDPLNLVPRTSYFSHENNNWRKHESEAVTQDKLDQWLRDSIAEIVKDIGKAPMLVHMFSHTGGTSMSIESESVSPDIWLL